MDGPLRESRLVVAGIADIGHGRSEQLRVLARVRIVARHAPHGERGMDVRFRELRFVVASVAEVRRLGGEPSLDVVLFLMWDVGGIDRGVAGFASHGHRGMFFLIRGQVRVTVFAGLANSDQRAGEKGK